MVARGCQGSTEVPVDLKRGLQTAPGPGEAARGQLRPKLTIRAAALRFDSSLVCWGDAANSIERLVNWSPGAGLAHSILETLLRMYAKGAQGDPQPWQAYPFQDEGQALHIPVAAAGGG